MTVDMLKFVNQVYISQNNSSKKNKLLQLKISLIKVDADLFV